MANKVISSSEIMLQYQNKVKECEEIKAFYEKRIAELREELRKVQKRQISLGQDNSEITKHIIRLSATGFNIKNIYDILTKQLNIDVDVERIKLVVDTIDNLPENLYKYYLQCKKEFKDKTIMDKNFFSSVIYKKYQLLENAISLQLQRAQENEDEKQITNCVQQLKSIYDSMSQCYSKNGINVDNEQTLEDLMEGYSTKPIDISSSNSGENTNISEAFSKIKEVG